MLSFFVLFCIFLLTVVQSHEADKEQDDSIFFSDPHLHDILLAFSSIKPDI